MIAYNLVQRSFNLKNITFRSGWFHYVFCNLQTVRYHVTGNTWDLDIDGKHHQLSLVIEASLCSCWDFLLNSAIQEVIPFWMISFKFDLRNSYHVRLVLRLKWCASKVEFYCAHGYRLHCVTSTSWFVGIYVWATDRFGGLNFSLNWTKCVAVVS